MRVPRSRAAVWTGASAISIPILLLLAGVPGSYRVDQETQEPAPINRRLARSQYGAERQAAAQDARLRRLAKANLEQSFREDASSCAERTAGSMDLPGGPQPWRVI
jgi:hypothetical protein